MVLDEGGIIPYMEAMTSSNIKFSLQFYISWKDRKGTTGALSPQDKGKIVIIGKDDQWRLGSGRWLF